MNIGDRILSIVASDLREIRIHASDRERRSLGTLVSNSVDRAISQALLLSNMNATFAIGRRHVDVMVAVWADCLPPRAEATNGELWEGSFEWEDDLEIRENLERIGHIVGKWSRWSMPPAIKSPGVSSGDQQPTEMVQQIWAPFVTPIDTDFLGEVRYSTRSVLLALLPWWDLKDLPADLQNFLAFRKILAAMAGLLPSKGLSLSWGPNAETDGAWGIPKGGLDDFQFLEGLFLRLHPGLAYDGVVRASLRESFKAAGVSPG